MDSRLKMSGMTEGGDGGKNKGGGGKDRRGDGGQDRREEAGRTGGTAASLCHARRFPDNQCRGQALSGIQSLFSFLGEDGFPIKNVGNDRGGDGGKNKGGGGKDRRGDGGQDRREEAGRTGGTVASLSVMPDGFNRASRVFFLLPLKMDSRLKMSGMTEGEMAGKTRVGAGRTEEETAGRTGGRKRAGQEGRGPLSLSCPTVLIGHPGSFFFSR